MASRVGRDSKLFPAQERGQHKKRGKKKRRHTKNGFLVRSRRYPRSTTLVASRSAKEVCSLCDQRFSTLLLALHEQTQGDYGGFVKFFLPAAQQEERK